MSPLVLGEVACGTPPERAQTLADLRRLATPRQATLEELLRFLERHELYGQGCGLIDISLLSSALISPEAVLWTLDKRLHQLASRFEVAWHPGLL
jgi:hypothetical protein